MKMFQCNVQQYGGIIITALIFPFHFTRYELKSQFFQNDGDSSAKITLDKKNNVI